MEEFFSFLLSLSPHTHTTRSWKVSSEYYAEFANSINLQGQSVPNSLSKHLDTSLVQHYILCGQNYKYFFVVFFLKSKKQKGISSKLVEEMSWGCELHVCVLKTREWYSVVFCIFLSFGNIKLKPSTWLTEEISLMKYWMNERFMKMRFMKTNNDNMHFYILFKVFFYFVSCQTCIIPSLHTHTYTHILQMLGLSCHLFLGDPHCTFSSLPVYGAKPPAVLAVCHLGTWV